MSLFIVVVTDCLSSLHSCVKTHISILPVQPQISVSCCFVNHTNKTLLLNLQDSDCHWTNLKTKTVCLFIFSAGKLSRNNKTQVLFQVQGNIVEPVVEFNKVHLCTTILKYNYDTVVCYVSIKLLYAVASLHFNVVFFTSLHVFESYSS